MANLDEYTIEVLKKDDKTIIPITTTQAVFTSTGKTVEDSIVEFEDDDETEIEVSPDVLVNVEIPEGITATPIETMKVGNDYYVAASGGKLYRHSVRLSVSISSDAGWYGTLQFDLLTTSNSTFTASTVIEYLKNKGGNFDVYKTAANMGPNNYSALLSYLSVSSDRKSIYIQGYAVTTSGTIGNFSELNGGLTESSISYFSDTVTEV